MYAIYNKEKLAESDGPYDLIRSLRLIVATPLKKISIYDNENNLLISSKFYSKLDKWADLYYNSMNQTSFTVKPLLSDMDDNDETEFYL